MASKKLFGKRFLALAMTLAMLISLIAMVAGVSASASGGTYTPKRVLTATGVNTEVNAKLAINKATLGLTSGQIATIKGYYKVENFVALNQNASTRIVIGTNADAPIDVTANTEGWVPFELTTTVGAGYIYFEHFYTQGTLSLADITVEDEDGNKYDMATDAALIAGDYTGGYDNGTWWAGHYNTAADATFHFDPVYYAVKRVLTATGVNTEVNAKLAINKATLGLTSGQIATIKGYYKVENFVALNQNASTRIVLGTNADAPIDVTANTDGWVPFELTTTVGAGYIYFEHFYTQGTLSLADITVEDEDGNKYDMATDAALIAGDYTGGYDNGTWWAGHYNTASDATFHFDPVYYAAKRVLTATGVNTEVNAKLAINKATLGLTSGQIATIKGYYKVENFVALNQNASTRIVIGTNADAPIDVTANTKGWVPFELTTTVGAGYIYFEHFYTQGTLSLADITVEDEDGNKYEMATDATLVGGDYTGSYDNGTWWAGFYNTAADATFHFDPVYIPPVYEPDRVMSITAASGDVNSKMIITKSGTVLGAGIDVTVHGYYKVENYTVVNAANNPGVLIKGVNVGGNTDGWVEFTKTYTTNDDDWFGFEFWYATGTLSLADITITNADDEVIYDMRYDTNLPEGEIVAPHGDQRGMWYLSYYNVADGCVVNIDPAFAPPAPPDIYEVELPEIPNMMAEDSNGYAPNRAFGIISTLDTNPKVTWAVWGDDFLDADKYYVFANVQVSGFNAFENATDAACSISLLAGEYNAVIGKWTADTNGWVPLVDANGDLISFDKLATADDSVVLTFETKNAAANFMIGDLIVADDEGNIIYSLANDKTMNLESDMRYTTSTDWNATPFVANENGPTLFPIRTKGNLEYTPNVGIAIYPLNWLPGCTQENSIIIRSNAAPFVAGETYTITGKINVVVLEGYNGNTNPRADFTAHTLGPIGTASICDTDGWVSLVYPNGDPITFKGTAELDYIKFNLYQTHGAMALADIVITDSQGNVVYDMAEDEALLNTDSFVHEGWIDIGEIWRIALYGEEYSSCEIYVNDEPVEHTAADYTVPTFDETVEVPEKEEPKLPEGSKENPIKAEKGEEKITVAAGEEIFYTAGTELDGMTLVVKGEGAYVIVDGKKYEAKNGVVSVVLSIKKNGVSIVIGNAGNKAADLAVTIAKDDNANTGDTSAIFMAVAAAVMSMTGTVALVAKKRDND